MKDKSYLLLEKQIKTLSSPNPFLNEHSAEVGSFYPNFEVSTSTPVILDVYNI